MDIKLNDYIKVNETCIENLEFPNTCIDSYQECEIQIVGRRFYTDETLNAYLCTVVLNGKKHGWKALEHGSVALDEASVSNIKQLYPDGAEESLFWILLPHYIDSVVKSTKSSCQQFQAKDEQLRADIKFFFPDLSEPWNNPGHNGFKYL